MGTYQVPILQFLFVVTFIWSCEACFEFTTLFPNPCSEKVCPFGAECIPSAIDGRSAECVCPSKCRSFGDSRGSRPVCSSNGKTYSNLCELNRDACKLMKAVTVLYNGSCDPCYGMKCPDSQICQIDDQRNPVCKCNAACGTEFEPVCASNGKSYANECILRLEACKTRKSLRILHQGVCPDSNSCKSLKCTIYQECEVNRYGIAECQCPTTCAKVFRPVCSTDFETFSSECELRRQACLSHRNITIRYMGVCDPQNFCHQNHGICKYGSICQSLGLTNYTCVCTSCSEEYSPVCANDISYTNICKFRHDMCQKKMSNVTIRQGSCDGCEKINCMSYSYCESKPGPAKCTCPQNCENVPGSRCENGVCKVASENLSCQSSKPIGSKASKNACEESGSGSAMSHISPLGRLCPVNVCKYDGVCVVDDASAVQCICQFNCSSNTGLSTGLQMCGSDGRMYNECTFREEMCRRQQEIELAENIYCEKYRNIPCEGEPPLVDETTRKEYNCSEESCPESSYCHRGLTFAKCCRELDPDENCYDSPFGCCPDEKTHSPGPNYAGCPSTCQCNRLGSLGVKCDPLTKQCPCKPAVGGQGCDRCEAGYWGMHKISEGNSGCIPCMCSKIGSSRPDCQQNDGRCVCRPGFKGIKCDICADGSPVESYGCARVESISCTENSQCKFGATCRDEHCRCDIDCSNSKKAQVCANDGFATLAFQSECHLKLWSCRAQKHLTAVNAEKCLPSAKNSATTSPVRRSTEYQNYEKSTRKVLNTESEATMGTGPTMPTLHWDSESEQMPFFNGKAYIEMSTLQAYSKVSVQVELIAYEAEGVILFNAQTSTGEGDYIALLLKNLFVELRFNLGSGSVFLRSALPIVLGQIVTIDVRRHLSEGFLSVDGFENVTGKSDGPHKLLDLGDSLYIGGTPYSEVKKISDVLGTKKNFTGCLRSLRINEQVINLEPSASKTVLNLVQVDSCSREKCSQSFCHNGGTCTHNDRQSICLCLPNFTGAQCQHNSQLCTEESCLQNSISIWDFWNNSYVEMPTLQGVSQAFRIEVWIMARSPNGIILYNGQSKGDFVELSLVEGYVHYSFNLGGQSNKSGTLAIKSNTQLSLGEWHRVVVTRNVKEGILEINDEPAITNFAKGNLNELNLDEPLYFGGIGEKSKRNAIGTNHFNGAIERITLNGSLWGNALSRANKIVNVQNYQGPPCGYENPCLNQGKCISWLNTYICQCTTEFHGLQCEQKMDSSVKLVRFDNFYFVEYDSNYFPRSKQQENRIELTLHTRSANGLLIWTSKDSQTLADYLAVALVDGFLEFRFNLEKQSQYLAVLRSSNRIDDGETHNIILSRNKRVGIIQIDNKYMNSTVSERGATELNSDKKLWIGGFSNLPVGLPDAYFSPFSGCLISVRVDGIALDLTSLTGDLISKCQ